LFAKISENHKKKSCGKFFNAHKFQFIVLNFTGRGYLINFKINHICLAIPGKILKIKNHLAEVDFDGVQKDINISLVDVEIGDYVMVHAGFAIEKMEIDVVADIQEYLKK